MPLQRITHTGAAPPTGLANPISASAMSFALTDATGYPTGAGGPFVIDIDAALPSEEKVLCQSLSGASVTVFPGGRGFDGTTAAAHNAGPKNVSHVISSAEADDSNAHIYTPSRDDHTQYVRADGTRSVTGGLTIAGGLNVGGPVAAGGVVSGVAFAAAGVGAFTLPARFMGSTGGGGPPGAGTFQQSDYVVDPTGAMWVCTVAGTPGTWVKVGAAAVAGVTQLVAGTNVSLSPAGGTGVVTVNAAGGGSAPTTENTQTYIGSNVSLPGGTLTAVAACNLSGAGKTWLLLGHILFSASASQEQVDFGFWTNVGGYIGMTSQLVPGSSQAGLQYSALWNSGGNSSYVVELVCFPGQTSAAFAAASNTSQPNASGMQAIRLA